MYNFSKLTSIIRSKIEKLEDPEDNLEAAWQQQLDVLHKLKASLGSIRTTRLYMEGQWAKLTYETRTANRQHHEPKLINLETEIKKLKLKEKHLDYHYRELETHIEDYRIQKDLLKARYAAAQTVAKRQKAALDKDDENLKAKQSMRKLGETVLQLEAKAAAIDELVKDQI